ncbi:mannose-1-phosphate guanyltransferase [Aureimonas sp. Leaf454]|uniref:mannose-1-phosphate guanylyltransferase/mannose-6-phosphate isomerase n=1 Tax=Aureimonas sp. Leaf454 TaxID=1736381 RepID=UPI0006F818A4|nr:mannose-1-phosphate guanylyltransferase/mannose-6-phosphate isomerase [Aureimonas sp. Leaf454]KQT50990.1 mannose-1-phosphate guanyltransferase [Aureimonas sp. Leaf454]
MTTRIVPIIMAGGAGTRLWPISRDSMPKQFISLMSGERSTFETTLQRVSGADFERPIVVTSDAFRFICAEQLRAAGVEADIVLEPERRDSAAAVAVGALLAARRDPQAICVVLASDHAILDGGAFVADCRRAAALAERGIVMTLGIPPTHASTAYGYIAPGDALDGHGAHKVARFVEKPDAETAEDFIAKGYVWNSGNFIFRTDTMLAEFEAHAPEVLASSRLAVDGAVRDLDFLRLDPDAFAKVPKISVDIAVMEKTRRAGVLSASFDWSDIGSWDALYDISDKDAEGNVLSGNVEVFEASDNFVRSDGMLTAVVGLKDTIVVATSDAVVVAAKSAAGRVKDVVASLKAKGRREASEHLRMFRPWGWYQRIDIGQRFQVKHICVKPGGILSLQRHYHRAEHWIVVHGTAEVTVDGTVKLYHENEAAYLPIGCTHRLHNPGKIELKLIEVQVGSYTGEDDIVRIEDVYART